MRFARYSAGEENEALSTTEEATTQSETPTEILDETSNNTDNLFEDL